MSVILIAEHNNTNLSDATAKALSAARALDSEVDILVAGENCASVAQEAAQFVGVRKIRVADAPHYAHQLAEPMADLIASLADDYSAFVAAATNNGKNYMPRLAALLDISQVSDVIEIVEPRVFVHPIYAGNAFETVKVNDSKSVLTVRTTAFAATEMNGNTPIENVACIDESGLSEFIGEELTKSDRPELTSAKIIISGGRGMQSGENFHLLEKIAGRLGAGVGASRAAVDAGFVPNDYQVGQTGKVVAPDLYIAVGISGAIQHLAGMKDSKVIVAINKDEDAPIFQIADYGLVADLFNVMPELDVELEKAGY